jgi:hypothetical protein
VGECWNRKIEAGLSGLGKSSEGKSGRPIFHLWGSIYLSLLIAALVRVRSCDFVDRTHSWRANDPRNSTKHHEMTLEITNEKWIVVEGNGK